MPSLKLIPKSRLLAVGLALLAAVELAVLGFLFLRENTLPPPVVLEPAQLVPYEGDVVQNEDGVALNAFAGYSGTFAYSGKFELPAGSYRVAVSYENSGAAVQYNFAATNGLDGLKWDTVTLPAGQYYQEGDLRADHAFAGDGALLIRFTAACEEAQYVRIGRVEIVPTRQAAGANLAGRGLWLLLADLVLVWWLGVVPFPLRSTRARCRALGIAGIACAGSIQAGTSYLYGGYDFYVHLGRIEGLAAALAGGQFPARLYTSAVSGRGYPFGIMYPDLALYPAALLRAAGFTLEDAYRAFAFYITLATALIAYYVIVKMSHSDVAALLGTALYVLSPERMQELVDSIGIVCGKTFLPLIVYGFWCVYTRAADEKSRKWCWVPLAVGFSAVLQTHILTLELATFFSVLFCLLNFRKTFTRPVLTEIAKAAAVTVALNLWFLVPFLQFLRVCVVGQGGGNYHWFQSSGTPIAQLLVLYGPDGTLPSGTLKHATWSAFPGVLWLAGAALAVAVLCDRANRRDNPALTRGIAFTLGLGSLSVLMGTEIFPWRTVFAVCPPLAEVVGKLQYAQRLYTTAPALLVVAVSCAATILLRRDRTLGIAVCATLAALMLVSCSNTVQGLMAEASFLQMPSGAAIDDMPMDAQIGIGREYLPHDLTEENLAPTTPGAPDGVTVTGYTHPDTTARMNLQNDTAAEATVLLPLYYYPGYRCDTPGATLANRDGLVAVTVPSGWNAEVAVRWAMPWYWRISDLMSLVTAAALPGIYLRKKREKRRCEQMEIERKWMVPGWPAEQDALGTPESVYQMDQGYLSVRPTVRIRREALQGGRTALVLCFKGAGGLVREEIETEIDESLFARLEALIGKPLIRKERRCYALPGGLELEVNRVDAGQPGEFYYAEVEFATEAEALAWQPTGALAAYLAEECTGQPGSSMGDYWVATRGNPNGTPPAQN